MTAGPAVPADPADPAVPVDAALTTWSVAADTPDPELPQVTLADLGILRSVVVDAGRVVVTITPTYSGCPALTEIRTDLAARLRRAGHPDVEIRTQLAPPWTSDWITADGRAKLAAAGIAPPTAAGHRSGPVPLRLDPQPVPADCPLCGSTRTRQTAAFSATACKALHRCDDCGEPFESIKAI